ncbi:hypothetical protein N7527_004867 [Penicillium freii]|nr:hypothetical protein N7527_004867 [Penicillium freii]
MDSVEILKHASGKVDRSSIYVMLEMLPGPLIQNPDEQGESISRTRQASSNSSIFEAVLTY